MNRKKVLALAAGLVILAGAAVPGTLAVEADSASAAGTVVVGADAPEESADASDGVANFAAEALAAVQSETQATAVSDGDESGTGSTQDGAAAEGTSVETAAEGAAGASGTTSTESASDAANVAESATNNTTDSINSSDITDTTDETAGKTSDKASDKTSDKTTEDTTADGVTGKTADTAKKAAETKTCTCGAAEDAAHQKDCPLYVSAESFQHKDGCSDECSDEACTCGCHLYDRIMACDNIDDLWILIDNADEASIELLTDEQNKAIDAKIEELEPEPEPAIVIEESDEIVPSEIGYESISFTDVAPLGDPVIGGEE